MKSDVTKTSPALTEPEWDILLHTVGLDRAKTPYRNAYITATGGDTEARVKPLLTLGYLQQRPYPLRAGHTLWQATELGLHMARWQAEQRAQSREALRCAQAHAELAAWAPPVAHEPAPAPAPEVPTFSDFAAQALAACRRPA